MTGCMTVGQRRCSAPRLLSVSQRASAGPPAPAPQVARGKTQNVVLIVSDGLRWQEVFTGAEEDLLNDNAGGSWLSDEELRKRYWRATPVERREALFPFLWGTVAKRGQIFGNQTLGSIARVTERQGVFLSGLQRDEHRLPERCHRQQ